MYVCGVHRDHNDEQCVVPSCPGHGPKGLKADTKQDTVNEYFSKTRQRNATVLSHDTYRAVLEEITTSDGGQDGDIFG